jgi:hypothetical protein
VAVNHVFATGSDFDRHNMSRKFCGKGQLARPSRRAVFGHEKRSAADDAL